MFQESTIFLFENKYFLIKRKSYQPSENNIFQYQFSKLTFDRVDGTCDMEEDGK